MSDQSEHFVPGADTRRARILRRAEVDQVPLRTILVTVSTVVAFFIVGKLLYRLRDILLLMLVGAFFAVIVNPLVVILERWKIRRRGAAVAIVALLSIFVFFALAFAFGYPLVNGLTHLANTLPAYFKKAQQGKGWIGHLLLRYHVETWVNKNSAKLVSLAQNLGKPALALGKGAVSVMLALLTTFAFGILLLLEAPRMRRALLVTISPERAERFAKIGREVSRSTTGYMLGNFLTSMIAGIVVFITLSVLGVPFALLWGLWVALVDFLPTIGGALAGIPTIIFAFGHSLTAGIVTAVVFLIYTQLENHVLNPVIMSRTVRLNPLAVFVAVIVGADLGAWVGGLIGGFVGVMIAVPAAATFQVTIREIWKSTGNPDIEALADSDEQIVEEPTDQL